MDAMVSSGESAIKQSTSEHPSGFSSSYTEFLIEENKYSLRLLKMNDSAMIFICRADPEILEKMGVSMRNENHTEVIGTSVLGSHINSESQTLAEKLTKRFGLQFYVSLNVQVDRMTGPLLEKKIIEYTSSTYNI